LVTVIKTLWCYWIWIQICEEYTLYAMWCSTYMEYSLHVCTICCLYHVVLWCQLSYVPKVLQSHPASLHTVLLNKKSRCEGSVWLNWRLLDVYCITLMNDGWWLVVCRVATCVLLLSCGMTLFLLVFLLVLMSWCLNCGCALSCLWFCLCWWLYFSYLYLYL
jgi:hypothetical protein